MTKIKTVHITNPLDNTKLAENNRPNQTKRDICLINKNQLRTNSDKTFEKLELPTYSSLTEIYKYITNNNIKNEHYFSIIHINLRSINKNFDKLHQLISQMPFDPNCIAITETKINKRSNLNSFQLDRYDFIHVDSLTCAGGVGLYINNSLQYDNRPDLNLRDNNYESVWAEVKVGNKKYTIGVVYTVQASK